MDKQTTTITDPHNITQSKSFTFDYSYWSHDGYIEDEKGYFAAVDDRYADQVRP